MNEYKYGETRQDGYVYTGLQKNRYGKIHPIFRHPVSFKQREDLRNSNKSYLKAEKMRLSKSPEDFLGRWLTRSRYESTAGLKDKIAENVTKEWLKEKWNRVEGRCAHSNKKMTFIRGRGALKTNVSIVRDNHKKPFTRDNIVFVQLQYRRLWDSL